MKLLLETSHYWALSQTKELYQIFEDDGDSLKILVNGKEERNQISVLSNIFNDALNMDEWKHGWHIDTTKYNELEIRDKIYSILKGKIEDRERQVEQLERICDILVKITDDEIRSPIRK